MKVPVLLVDPALSIEAGLSRTLQRHSPRNDFPRTNPEKHP
jgi:hypothetical protein